MRKEALAVAVLATMGTATDVPASSPCSNGIVIPEPQEHPALVEDCEALLAVNLRTLLIDGAGLTGSIPPEMGALSNLRHLDLRRNQLTGPIPPEFGQLKRLETLWLGENELTDSILRSWGVCQN